MIRHLIKAEHEFRCWKGESLFRQFTGRWDAHAFDVGEAGDFVLTVESPVEPRFVVLDGDGNQIAYGRDRNADGARAVGMKLDAGRYYLLVIPSDTDSATRYEADLTQADNGCFGDKPDESGAEVVSADVTIEGALYPAGDTDWWAVEVTQAGRLIIDPNGLGAVIIELESVTGWQDEAGETVAVTPEGWDWAGVWVERGRYRLKVRGLTSETFCPYGVSLDFEGD